MNSLVFHNKQQLASCFIHLTPCSLTWCLRWYAERINTNSFYEGVIHIDPDLENETTFMEIALSGTITYMIWQAAHIFFMLVWGRFKAESAEKIAQGETFDTCYH